MFEEGSILNFFGRPGTTKHPLHIKHANMAEHVIDEYDASCPVCYEDFSLEKSDALAPALLSCRHNLCFVCKKLVEEKGKNCCPICRCPFRCTRTKPDLAFIKLLS